MSKRKTLTKGDVVVEDIKIGDIHYEFDYGLGVKSEVITTPVRDDRGYWSWKSKNTKTGDIIDYGVTEDLSHYAPNLYTYEAYTGIKYV